MMKKYVKPKSLSWWAGFAPLSAGLAVATAPMHGQAELVEVVNNMTGDLSAVALINTGAAIIGLRGAL